MLMCEFRFNVTMKFLQQNTIIGGESSIVGISSRKLKNNIKEAFDVVEDIDGIMTGLRTYSLTSANYNISYSSQRNVSPFVSEKDMFVHAEIIGRHRPYCPLTVRPDSRGAIPSHRQFTLVKEIVSKLQKIITTVGGSVYGNMELWAFLPIAQSDRVRLNRLFINNIWEFMPNFFNGEDIPDTIFTCIGDYSITQTNVPYLVSQSYSLGNCLRISTNAQYSGPMESEAHTRMIIGQSNAYDRDHYTSQEGVINIGYLVEGPTSAELINQVAAGLVTTSREPNIWGGFRYANAFPFDEEPDDDDDYYDEDDF